LRLPQCGAKRALAHNSQPNPKKRIPKTHVTFHPYQEVNMLNHELHDLLVTKIKTETMTTAEIIGLIAEAEKRKLYLDYDCVSLFAYLKALGYSNGSAQRRIDAARLHNQIPVCQDVAEGNLNLSQLSTLAQALRRTDANQEKKQEILNEIKNQDERASEITIHKMLDLKPIAHDKKHYQQDESVRVEVTFTKEQWELIQRIKDVISHVEPNPSLATIIEKAAHEFLKHKDPTSDRKSQRVTTTSIRREVHQEQRCCQWRYKDGKTCGSTFQVQIDHKKSKWRGGGDEKENLQILCSVHNKFKYNRNG
jgi:5-methylcytosine-specific restriction endonuclease McrA